MSDTQRRWYIRREGVINGPASAKDLRILIEAKRITLQQEASHTEEGPWRPLSDYSEFAPVRPIAELFGTEGVPQTPRPISELYPATKVEPPGSHDSPRQANVSPTALRLLDEAFNDGTLTQAERKEFMEGLTAEIRKNIGDKPTIWACVVFIITLLLVAGFSKILALVLASVGAGLVFKFAKDALGTKYLQPIPGYSDEMLVARYNEVKADRRAAGTRAAIGWAVVVIIGVILAILWLAARRQQ